MNYQLSYTGTPGSISGTLTFFLDGSSTVIDTFSGVSDVKAVKKLAKQSARAHREALRVAAREDDSVFVTVSGNQVFSL